MLIIKDTKNDTKIKTNNGVYVAIAEDGTAVAAHLDGINIFQVMSILKGMDELKERILDSNALLNALYESEISKKNTDNIDELFKDIIGKINENHK